MIRSLRLYIPGEPVPKARARYSLRGGKVRAYTPSATRNYESEVARYARVALQDAQGEVFTGPVVVTATFWLKRPASVKRELPHVKPDIDNYVKAILDGIVAGGLIEDDGQVVKLVAEKRYAGERLLASYGLEPCATVWIEGAPGRDKASTDPAATLARAILDDLDARFRPRT